MSDARDDRSALPADLDHEPAPDMIAELGPLAYGLFALGAPAPLTEVRALADSRAAKVPAQVERAAELHGRQDAILDELGELDL